jgi:Spy/CpxP family protein refolding chaperone
VAGNVLKDALTRITDLKEFAMKANLAAVLFAVVSMAAQCAFAEDKIADVTDMQALRNAVRTDRKAFVASTIKLTDAQAKKFWPAYDAYERTLDMANRRRVVAVEGLIARDKPMSDLYARNLAIELIASDETEIKARRTLHNRVMRILPATKAARYLQLESKIRAVQAYDIAATIPLLK